MSDIKNTQANEFLGRAAVLEAELADTSKELTLDEVTTRVEDIKALKQRALAVSEAKEKELEQRAADGHITLPTPESHAQEQAREDDLQAVSERAIKAFGSPGRYILALARRASPEARPWTEAQQKAHRALRDYHQTRALVGTASDASGGEFLLPLTQAADIFVGAGIVQNGLFERAPRYPCPGRTVRIPYLKQDVVTDTRPLSSISATGIVDETTEKPEHEPKIGQRIVTAYKWAAYTEAGDETLEDDYTGQWTSILRQAVGGDLANSINKSVTIGGDGTGEPLGALHANNGALYTVNRQTSQNIVVADVLAMLSRSTMGPGTFWIANPSTIPEILGMELSSGSHVTYLQNLGSAPSAMLLGFPLVWSHLMSQLGVAGDLALIDPAHYATVARREITMESSIHYKFRDDVTAYRFFVRAGGLQIPTSTYSFESTGAAKGFEFSPSVILGDDVTS